MKAKIKVDHLPPVPDLDRSYGRQEPRQGKAGGSGSWTDAEDAKAVAMRKSGMRYKQIAEKLGRTETAVKTRFAKKLRGRL